MKRAIKKKSNLYSYLDGTKVLETGSEQTIAQARSAYWRVYKAQWRRGQRKATKQYVIALSESEAKNIAEAATKHKRSTTRLLKESAMCYLNKTYLVPDAIALGTIRQLLAMNYNALQKLFDENRVPFEAGRELLSRMCELEQRVIAELYYPREFKNEEL